MTLRPELKTIVFDLDGTLADTALDFDDLRKKLGIDTPTAPILETVNSWPAPNRMQALQIIHDFEMAGAERAVLYDGVADFLEDAMTLGLKLGVFTRNSRAVAKRVMHSLRIPIAHLISRDDAPPKPSPEGLHELLKALNASAPAALMIGDYLYDVQAGLAAGLHTGLFLSSPISVESAPMGPDLARELMQKALFAVDRFTDIRDAINRNFKLSQPL